MVSLTDLMEEQDGEAAAKAGQRTPGGDRGGRFCRLQCRAGADPAGWCHDRDRGDQLNRLLPVPAADAPGERRAGRTAAHLRLAAPQAAQDPLRAGHGEPRRPSGESGELGGPGGRIRPGRLRPADPDCGQREQAAAGPRRHRLRARVPQHRRGHVPARSHHPAARAGRRGRRPRRASGALHLRGGRRGLHRYRGRCAGPAADEPGWPGRCPALPGRRSGGCCWTSRRGCCPSWIRGCPRPPSGYCGGAASR